MKDRYFEELSVEVGHWAEENFGDNKGVGAFAPLVGIAEELGELEDATRDEDKIDAYADIVIYFADFSYRTKLSAMTHFEFSRNHRHHETLTVAYGRLCHAFLKIHQGIRAKTDRDFVAAAENFWNALMHTYYKEPSSIAIVTPYRTAVKKTWAKVSNRNWKSNPTTGAAAPAGDEVGGVESETRS